MWHPKSNITYLQFFSLPSSHAGCFLLDGSHEVITGQALAVHGRCLSMQCRHFFRKFTLGSLMVRQPRSHTAAAGADKASDTNILMTWCKSFGVIASVLIGQDLVVQLQ